MIIFPKAGCRKEMQDDQKQTCEDISGVDSDKVNADSDV